MRLSTIYLHSPSSDFAETQRLSEWAYLGRHPRAEQPLRLVGCGCADAKLVRIGRSPWMRFVLCFRLYRCIACGAKVFRTRFRQRGVYGAVYLPPAPLPAATLPEFQPKRLRCN
jgi:hypothetical protein